MPDDFQSNLPEEYANSDFDFGFTAVDADELEGYVEPTNTPVDTEESNEALSQIVTDMEMVEGKLNAILLKLDNESDDTFSPPVNVDMTSIEEKIDQILAMENSELLSAVSQQGESIRAVIDEVEERKSQLNEQYLVRMREVEKLIMPLLYHLKKNPDKEYIYWPNRTGKIDEHIRKILGITRGN